MQEQLEFKEIPNVDTSRLSSVGQFKREVAEFQREFGINLEFNDNARWKPGSYERLKEQVKCALFPHWSKPKGANTIRRLTKYDNYSVNRLRDQLIKIDDKLKIFRANSENLDDATAREEGNVLYKEFMDNLLSPVDGVDIDLSPIPYFAKKRRSRNHVSLENGEIWEDNYDYPAHPYFNSDCELLGFDNYSANRYSEVKRVYVINTNPKRWFANIIIPIKDIALEYRTRDDDKVHATIPYGNLVVCFTVSLYDLIMNYRIIKAVNNKKSNIGENMLASRLPTQWYSGHTFKFPYIENIRHPFVQHSPNHYNYSWGNTCFGDYQSQITLALSTGNLSYLKVLLQEWSKIYYVDGTTPLNNTEFHHLGLPKDWPERVTRAIATNPFHCKTAVTSGYLDRDKLIDEYCNTCILKVENRCDVHSSFKRSYRFPEEFNELIHDAIRTTIKDEKVDYDYIALITIMSKKVFNAIAYPERTDISSVIIDMFLNNDKGHGNLLWDDFYQDVDTITRDIMAPDEDINYEIIALSLVRIFRRMERIYWEYTVSHHNSSLWEQLASRAYSLEEAEKQLPISDYRFMYNTYAVSNNVESIKEFGFDLIRRYGLASEIHELVNNLKENDIINTMSEGEDEHGPL